MSKKVFDLNAALSDGWQLFLRCWPDLILVFLINFVLTSAVAFGLLISFIGWLLGIANNSSGLTLTGMAAGIISTVVTIFIAVWISASYKEVAAAAIKNEKTPIFDYYRRAFAKTWQYLGVYFLITLVILVGLILFIIPGIIFAIWYLLAPYIVAVEKVGPVEAMRRSRKLIQPYFWWILLLSLLIGAVTTLVSALPYSGGLIGLLTTPLATAVWAGVYRYLKKS